MYKKDAIFWWATGLFILSLVMLTLTNEQYWLSLMIVSYLLRPTLASLGLRKKNIDERQMSIHYRSGNIAFAVTIIACVIFMAKMEMENDHTFEYFAMIIAIGLATKALFNVMLVKNYREGATKIIITIGLIVALFGALEGSSFSSKAFGTLPGLAIAAIGLLSRKYPRPIAILLFAVMVFLLVVILGKGFSWGQIVTAVLVVTPMTIAGLCLFFGDKAVSEGESANPI